MSQFYKKEGQNKVRLVSVTENTVTGRVSVMENESLYNSGVPNLLDFLSTDDVSIKADRSETRLVSSNGSESDNLLFINHKDEAVLDELVLNGQEAIDFKILKISTNALAPEYLLTFRLTNEGEQYVLSLRAEVKVEGSEGAALDLLDGDQITVTSDELSDLVDKGLYGELSLTEYGLLEGRRLLF